MRILVAVKHPGNIAKKVTEIPFSLDRTPHSLRELIEETVRACISAYRVRAEVGETPPPLTDRQLAEMREVGKFAFGVHYNKSEIDEAKAVERAIEAVNDGLVRIFRGNDELKASDLDGALTIAEDDRFTFVRLTMLSGRMW